MAKLNIQENLPSKIRQAQKQLNTPMTQEEFNNWLNPMVPKSYRDRPPWMKIAYLEGYHVDLLKCKYGMIVEVWKQLPPSTP